MSFKEKMNEFKKRWKISEASDYKIELDKFKNRILNIVETLEPTLPDGGIQKFCQALGIEEVWRQGGFESYSENIEDHVRKTKSETELYYVLQVICYVVLEHSPSPRHWLSQIKSAIDFSDINLSISITSDDVILHPKGEKELDIKLVDEVLSFLDSKSHEHFADALKFYQSKKTVKSAESLRRCVEEFLRFKLKNQKGLKENISELGKSLKQDSRDPQVRNIITNSIGYLDQYFNENSKHQDGDINEAENEFLIYQIGVLMRYLDKSVK